jgi:enoyl-CoA hydratase
LKRFHAGMQMITKMSAQHDFREGVRAAVVDKDKNPAWIPSSLERVDQQQVDAIALPAPGVTLAL